MKILSLDAGQRAQLVDLLGQQTGKMSLLSSYWRTIELLRISEAEATELGLKVEITEGQSRIFWDPSVPLKEFNLEDSDAGILRALLESWEHFQPSQVPSITKILEALR